MKLSVLLLLLPMLASCTRLPAQDADTPLMKHPGWEHHDEVVLMTGYAQGRYGYGELGVGRSVYGISHLPYGMGYYLAAEVRVDRPEYVGVKIGAYVTGGFAMGLQLIRYTDGHAGCTVLRPEIGIGIGKAKVTYAYNLQLSRPELSGINTHMLCLSYGLRIKPLRGDHMDPHGR